MYKKYILDLVDNLCPNKRKPIYTAEYYLDNIISVLKDKISWNSLKFPDKPKNHGSAIRKIFVKWTKLNIFQLAYKKIIEDIYIPVLDERNRLNLLIDSSKIYNKNGKELIGVDYENPKKKVTKLSIITDTNKLPLGIEIFNGKEHDTNTIIETYNDLPLFVKHSKINLIGDKGYILKLNRKKKLYKKNIILITQRRRNQKKRKLDKYKILKLKDRYKVEHSIEQLKKYNRIMIRRDSLIMTYKSFVYLGLILNCDNYFVNF